MSIIVVTSLPNDGDTAVVESYNDAINAILAVVNGNLDDNNIASLNGSKLTPGSVPDTALSSSAHQGWHAAGAAPSAVTALGNRNYQLTFSATDLTSTLSPGNRLKLTRTVAAPTQCTTLNGSNQWFSNSSPNGMTFVDDFAVSGWVKLSSYGSPGTIVSRYNGTSGWALQFQTLGTVVLVGYNASSSNFSQVLSTQAIPLNKWVHIAAQLDMSSFTATPTTSYIMIDGVDVPATVSRGGTSPVALVQAGNLEVGSQNAGTGLLPGELAQVAIYSNKVTQANMLATISQGLVGTETNLISAYSFNNAVTDLNANANTLTAHNSAVATTNDSPFGQGLGSTLEYAIAQTVAFSTNTTVVVSVPEGSTIPTAGGVTSVAYSNSNAFGFPGKKGKWRIEAVYRSAQTVSPTGGTWYNFGQLAVPVGNFITGYSMPSRSSNGSAGVWNMVGTLSTANNTNSNTYLNSVVTGGNNATSNAAECAQHFYKEQAQDFAAQTILFYNMKTGSTVSNLDLDADSGDGIIFAQNAWL